MKKIVLLSIGLLFYAGVKSQEEKVVINQDNLQVNVLYSDEDKVQIEYKLGEFNKVPAEINGQEFFKIEIPGEPSLKEKGNPDLIKLVRSIAIPGDAKMELSVLKSEFVEYNLPVAPSKGILSRQVDPNTIPYEFSSVYQKNNYYPEIRAELGQPYILRDLRGVTVNVYPFAYNPFSQSLRVYTNLIIEVKNTGIDSRNTQPESTAINKYFEQIYKSRFINYVSNSGRPVAENGRMLVISANNFVDEMKPFVDHKNNKGLPTKIVSMNKVGSTANDIRNYIQKDYDADKTLTFVLLVGDNGQVPSLSHSGGGSDPSFSFVAGNDEYPDIIIGRFSAENESQVKTMVTRSIDYEKMGEQAWFHNGIGIASDDGSGNGDDNEYDWEHLRKIRTQLLGYHYSTVDELYEGSQGGEDAAGHPNATMVANLVNKGVSIINYTGHGSTTSWSTSGFSNNNVNSLTNNGMLPFIFSVACINGNFTSNTCFAETWLRATNNNKPSGAIGFYGSSINQSWSPPMEAQDEFNKLLTGDSYITFGALCYNGSWSMMDEYGTEGIKMFRTWHIFGDPSIHVIPHVQDCPSDLNITKAINGGSHEFLASNTIVASNTISNGATVHYGANKSVRLTPGFKVTSGSSFKADLNGCSAAALKSTEDIIMNENFANTYYTNEGTEQITEKNDFSENLLNIYPNPSQGVLTISFGKKVEDGKISIVDISGKEVYNQRINGDAAIIDLSDEEKGFYYAKISLKSETIIRKIILN